MTKSKFFISEYTGDQTIELTNVISIEAFNNSDVVAVINKFTFLPGEKVTIMLPDVTICDINLELYFMPIPILTGNNSRPTNIEQFSTLPGIFPAKIPAKLKQSVVLFVKKL